MEKVNLNTDILDIKNSAEEIIRDRSFYPLRSYRSKTEYKDDYIFLYIQTIEKGKQLDTTLIGKWNTDSQKIGVARELLENEFEIYPIG